MKWELICVDIDGTLLDDCKRLLPDVKESLRRTADCGVQIALASGRMPVGVALIEEELGIDCIKICNAGTYTIVGGKCIHEERLQPDMIRYIYDRIAEKYSLPLWIFRGREWFVTGIDQNIEREMEIIHYTPEIVDAKKLADAWERESLGPNKLLVSAEPAQIQEICQELRGWTDGEFDMARSADRLLEIFPKGINKGKALAALCQELGIDLKKTIAFGDQELDIPLIETAGVGIAMGNAIQELKDRADYVTKTNNEAGVAFALERYLAD